MIDSNAHIFVMAGGVGSRFWPKSRTKFPKQFIDIMCTGKSLLQSTVARFSSDNNFEKINIITNEKYRALVLNQIPNLPSINILCEPVSKNTAPCIAYAAFKLYAKDPNAVMVIVPSDHFILKELEYIKLLNEAVKYASEYDSLITLGITPTRPDSGYGYIKYDDEEYSFEPNFFKVKEFKEKPSTEVAKTYIDKGGYLWNSGVFIWKASSIVNAFKKYSRVLYELFSEGNDSYNSLLEEEFIKKHYHLVPNISIDIAVLEKADNIVTIPADIGWSDLGTWKSLHASYNPKDNFNNVVLSTNALISNTKNCIISTSGKKLIVIDGLNDYIVVEEADAILIFPKSREQNIRSITSDLNTKDLSEFL